MLCFRFSLLSLIADRTQDIWNKKILSSCNGSTTTSDYNRVDSERSHTPNVTTSPIPLLSIPPPPPLFSFSPLNSMPTSLATIGSETSTISSEPKVLTTPTTEAPAIATNGSFLITPSWENLQETAARLLFMAVRWVKCLAPFQTLSLKDQVKMDSAH